MSEKIYECIEIKDLKDMLNKTRAIYDDDIAYKIREGEITIKHILTENLGRWLMRLERL